MLFVDGVESLVLRWVRGICRAALKQLKQERIKKYEYCLPCECVLYLSLRELAALLVFKWLHWPNCAFMDIGVRSGYIPPNARWGGR